MSHIYHSGLRGLTPRHSPQDSTVARNGLLSPKAPETAEYASVTRSGAWGGYQPATRPEWCRQPQNLTSTRMVSVSAVHVCYVPIPAVANARVAVQLLLLTALVSN